MSAVKVRKLQENTSVTVDSDKVVFKKNNRDYIVFSEQSYQGREYIDIRSYYTDSNGAMKPTKKGITFNPSKLREFIACLSRLEQNLSLDEEEGGSGS